MTEGLAEPLPEHDAVGGGEEEFLLVYRENFSKIYAYFVRRAQPSQVADLVSEVFLVAWRRRGALPGGTQSSLWLYGVARRVMSQHLRATSRRNRLESKIALHRVDDDAPFGSELTDPTVSRVLRAIERLKDKDREVVKLVVWEGLGHAEVARIIGCSTNTVGIRLHRSLKQIRRKLGLVDE